MTTHLIGRTYPLTDGGSLRMLVANWLERSRADGSAVGWANVRSLPVKWVLALTSEGLQALMKDLGDAGCPFDLVG